MATQQSTIDDLLAACGPGVTAKAMFGEYCVYLDGKPVALVCDDRLFLKPTAAGRELLPDAEEASPYPGAKPHLVVPPEAWANLPEVLRATFAALPPVKAKRK